MNKSITNFKLEQQFFHGFVFPGNDSLKQLNDSSQHMDVISPSVTGVPTTFSYLSFEIGQH